MKKIIQFMVISLLLICSSCKPVMRIYYTDESRDSDSMKCIMSKNCIDFVYLADDMCLTSCMIPENLDGYLQTKITIYPGRFFRQNIKTISIVDCHVEIKNDAGAVIPYKSIEIKDQDYGKLNNTKSFASEKRYIESNPVLKSTVDLYDYIIYYTYQYKDFENIDRAVISIHLKLLIDGKEYLIDITKQIKRNAKLDIIGPLA